MKRVHHISFKHAWDGIVYVFTSQPNMRVHFAITLLIILLGIYFRLSSIEWLIILFTIVLVIVAEMINTSLESMTDLITEKYHHQARIAKDVSAGMVLVSAIASIIIGLAIFLPHFFKILPFGI